MADSPITSGTILSWNLTNWITVTLMALLAFAGIGALQKWYKNRQG
jgi:hypothetical protein